MASLTSGNPLSHLLDTDDIAHRLQLNRRQVQRLIKQERLPGTIEFNRRYFITVEALERFISARVPEEQAYLLT